MFQVAVFAVVVVLAFSAMGSLGLGRFVWRLGVLVAVVWLLVFVLLYAVADSADPIVSAFFTWGLGGAGAILAFAALLGWVFGGFPPRARS
jgi:hypothetical protein